MIQGKLHDGTQGPPWRCPSLCTWFLFPFQHEVPKGPGIPPRRESTSSNAKSMDSMEGNWKHPMSRKHAPTQKVHRNQALKGSWAIKWYQMYLRDLAGVFSQDAGPRLVLPWYEGAKMPWSKSATIETRSDGSDGSDNILLSFCFVHLCATCLSLLSLCSGLAYQEF